jgi:hypothetical protein
MLSGDETVQASAGGPERFVFGAEKLTSIFGRWPTFHDAEVMTLWLDRSGPCLRLRMTVFEALHDQVDDRGFYRKINECVVTLRFEEIRELVLSDFNHQNVLFGISFEVDGAVRVTIEGTFGVFGQFQCSKAIVEDVARTASE